MNNVVTCNVTILLHIFLNITESRKQVPGAAHTSQLVMTDISHTAADHWRLLWGNHWRSLLTEGKTAGVLVSRNKRDTHSVILNKRDCIPQYT